QILDILNRYEDYDLVISGHTDNTGDTYRNLDLSESRAKACYDYLLSRGVSADRISYVGYGEARPIATNASGEGRRLNRRVEFEIKFK
ncbi:MAG: OmpA family protein, partial [Saprospiraceae bacterium]|nr:OmpA family protein [Saprospiraceae bacterium]